MGHIFTQHVYARKPLRRLKTSWINGEEKEDKVWKKKREFDDKYYMLVPLEALKCLGVRVRADAWALS